MEKVFEFILDDVLGVLIAATVMYVLIIFYIRLFGKRSTSELNNFDWIVTVSIGSIIASTIILKDISIFEGGISILFLILLQYIITKILIQHKIFRNIIKSQPKLLFYKGKFIEENLHKERVLKPEIYAAIRETGTTSISDVYAVILETNSRISVIPSISTEEKFATSLIGVKGLPKDLENKINQFVTDNPNYDII